ncbi:MAG: TIR domain-containing protein [Deltaproteobacteria bacterium]|nr:TIR domain-containing protein [Deltaproteobacteria bacterium]
MNPIRLKGLTPDEFERLCLELVTRCLKAENATRRGGISDPDQGIDIEVMIGSNRIGVQCKTGRLTVKVLRETLRHLIHYPHPLDRFILMCAQHPVPSAIDEFRHWSSTAETIIGSIADIELWDPDRITSELDAYPGVLEKITEASRGPVFEVPIPRSSHFAGREIEIRMLNDLLERKDGSPKAVSIVGLAGTGKTTLAAEYAHRFRHSFPGGIYWLNGHEDILPQFARLTLSSGVAKPVTETAITAYTFLEALRKGPRSLIIIDDLDRPSILNEPLVGNLSLSDCGCKILITSRFAGLYASGVQRLSLDTLSESNAMSLLAQVSNRPEIKDPATTEHKEALQLCQELGHLPLAIHLAGSYLAIESRQSVGDYVEKLKSFGTLTSIDESEASVLHLNRYAEKSVTIALNQAYESIRDEEAKKLFQILSLLPENQKVTSETVPLLLGSFGNGKTKKAIAWLNNSGFIHVDEGGRIQLHPIVKSYGSSILTPDDRTNLAISVGESLKEYIIHTIDPNSLPKEQEISTPKVFLCYAGSDREQVEQLYERLQCDGFSPWMDKKSLLPGLDWRLEIKHSIETADFFIACISRHFQARTYGHKEIKLALEVLDMMPEGTIFLIPTRLEECSVDDRIASRQWVDLFKTDGYELLLKALRAK